MHLDPDETSAPDPRDLSEMLDIHEALDRLQAASPRRAELVKLRYFLGCSVAESAELLGVSLGTAEEDWRFAKAWLYHALRGQVAAAED
jgi:DNA-directed RNA polymerase specialized sigma24 family protein